MLAVLSVIPAIGHTVGAVGVEAWQRALAGAGAYVAATVVTSPVDVVKTRIQAMPGKQSSLSMAWKMFTKEGAGVFFAGLGPAMMMAPAAIAQYTLLEPLRAQMPLFAAAMIAGLLDITIKCPFDRLKTRRQGLESDDESTYEFFTRTVREGGMSALWEGYAATLVRDLPYLIIKWLVYSQSQMLLGCAVAERGTWLSNAKNLLAGAVAGAAAATAVTPADVVKTRMQVSSPGGRGARGGGDAQMTSTVSGGGGSGVSARSGSSSSGAVAVAQQILREEGPLAFFRGLVPRLARIPLYTAVTLATFELIKDMFAVQNGAGLLLPKREL